MNESSFLPEDDQDFLRRKAIEHQLLTEPAGQTERRGVVFPRFGIPDNLYQRENGGLLPGGTANVLVVIPAGYAKTKLDSWYVWPPLFLPNGGVVDRAGSEANLFGQKWQFWSRHLASDEWRPDVDGLETYIQYINAELRKS